MLAGLTGPVKLVNFTQELACEYCRDTEQLVREVADLSDKITAEVYNFQIDNAPSPEEAHRVIASALLPMVAATLGPAEYEQVRRNLAQLPEPPSRPRLRKDEWLGALAVFLWVFLTTFPVAIPFIFMSNVGQAMRVSNATAVVLLFMTGYAFGRITGRQPWLVGCGMVVLGLLLVGLTMAQGG